MSHKLARARLRRSQLDKLPAGATIVDANMTVYTKREHTMWECEDGTKIALTNLLRPHHTPLRLWPSAKVSA